MQKHLTKVAAEVQSINDAIKNIGIYELDRNPEKKKNISDRVNNLIKYAEKNGVPLKVSAEGLMKKVRDTELGEMEEEWEDSSEEWEDSSEEDWE